MPKERFKQEVEKELTGREREPRASRGKQRCAYNFICALGNLTRPTSHTNRGISLVCDKKERLESAVRLTLSIHRHRLMFLRVDTAVPCLLPLALRVQEASLPRDAHFPTPDR
jgi:hypothetical protein